MTFGASDLAPGTKITFNGSAKQLSDITPGCQLAFYWGDSLDIREIKILAMPGAMPSKGGGAKAPAGQWNKPSINGKVRWWTGQVVERGTTGSGAAAQNMFVLKRPGGSETATFHPEAGTRFYVSVGKGKPSKAAFSDVTIGRTAEAASQDGKLLEVVVLE
jgi:hypothetical protein